LVNADNVFEDEEKDVERGKILDIVFK